MVFLFQVTVRKPSMELPSLTVERLLQANDLIGAEKSIDEFYSKIRDGYRLAHTNPGEIKKKDPELYRQYQKDMSELDKCNSKLNDFERKNPVLYKELLLKGIGSEDVGTSNIATNLAMDRLPGELEHGKELTFGRWGAADAREVASKIYACRENGGVAGAWDGMAAGIVSNILLALDGHYNMNSWPLPKEKPEDLLEKGDVKDLLAIMSARKFGNVSERIFVETMKVALKDDDPYVRMNAYALMDGAFGEYILYQNTRNNGWYEKHFSKKATLELSKLIIENEEDMKKEKGTRPWELVMDWRDVLKGAKTANELILNVVGKKIGPIDRAEVLVDRINKLLGTNLLNTRFDFHDIPGFSYDTFLLTPTRNLQTMKIDGDNKTWLSMNGLTPGGKTRVDVAILERKDSKSGKAEFYVQEANNAGKVGIIHYVVEYGRNKTDIKQIYDNKPISPMIKTLEP